MPSDEYLADEDLKLLTWFSRGETSEDATDEFHYSRMTIARKMQKIAKVLGTKNRTHSVAEAIRRGHIE